MESLSLTSAELSTIRLALVLWQVYCGREADQMRQWAIEMPDSAEKCLANAIASDRLANEAAALLEALP